MCEVCYDVWLLCLYSFHVHLVSLFYHLYFTYILCLALGACIQIQRMCYISSYVHPLHFLTVYLRRSPNLCLYLQHKDGISLLSQNPKKEHPKIKGNQHSVSSQTKHWLKIKAKVVNCKISNPATHHWNRHLVVFLTWQDDGRWLHNVSCCSNLREWAHPAL